MKINEIFTSIEGEGSRSGYPVTFIRLFGCNMNCSYCDTRYSCEGNDWVEMSIDEIIDKVKSLTKSKRISLTGGEPLIHPNVKDLIKRLVKEGYEVGIETNGSVDLSDYIDNPKVMLTMDYKSLSSKMNHLMNLDNLNILRNIDAVKFVVGSDDDLNDMKKVIEKYNIKAEIFISPIFGKIEPANIVQYILDNNLNDVRMQLQIHKFIWDPEMKGV